MSAQTNPIDSNLNRILIVDDEEIVLSALREQLKPEGFEVTTLTNPMEALEKLQSETYSMVLADQDMQELSGLDFLARVRDLHPITTRLILTHGGRVSAISGAIKSGQIYRFVVKPWMREELLMAVHNSVEHYRYLAENKRLHEGNVALNLQISRLAPSEPEDSQGASGAGKGVPVMEESRAALGATSKGIDLTVGALIKMIYTFHPNLGSTAVRAVALCKVLGEVLELGGDDLKNLLWAAALHDISLVGLDHALVRKWLRSPDRCSPEEMAVIKRHPVHSKVMLEYCSQFRVAGEIVVAHHENWDGTGYPEGLKGEEIPWLSRLLAAVIFFCGKHTANIQAMAEMEIQAEKMFDPNAILAVARAVPMTRLPRGEREIQLIELKPAMVLARDIYNVNGFLLLPKGRELTESAINKLFSINRETPIDPLALVYC
jgi:response regulator RpfG family c-di-GMP phosphodiesterase